MPLAPGDHVTLFKCQGLTCGNDRDRERLLLYCENLLEGEKRWPRSFYVALTRTINASDLALINTTGLKSELWVHINNASYHAQRREQTTANEQESNKTVTAMAKHLSDARWVQFLASVDACANDGVHDAVCHSLDKTTCAHAGCAACIIALSA